MRSKRMWCVILSAGLATLGVLALLTRLDGVHVTAQGTGAMWPLTSGGGSRFAGWSPDGHTVLINRWGAVVGEENTRQALSELWAVSLLDGPSTSLRIGPTSRLSENAIQPAYTGDGQRLAYLAFDGGGRWQVRVLNLASGQGKSWGAADWRMEPVWIGEKLAFARDGKVWLSSEGVAIMAADLPTLPTGARIRLTTDGTRAAWSEGTHLWMVHIGMGEEPQLLATDTQVLNFAWSPDGRRLVYVVADESIRPELWVANADVHKAPLLLVQGQAELFSAPSWSPDGRTLAFSRTPLGAATACASDIWLVSADGGDLHPLLRNDLEESSPAWSPDGRYLAFNRTGDVWVLDMSCGSTCASISPPSIREKCWGWGSTEDLSNLAVPMSGGAVGPFAQQTPPDIIRVIHRAENYHRWDVPPGHIDWIDFEDYVKRVVPVEMPASWPAESLKAQAVAARTYGWYYTEDPPHPDWDVSDWVDYQVMGDRHYPQTDAATNDTQGQYIAYLGEVIKAFYSAENGCPTRGLKEYAYIQAVDDPVSFGEARRGHGWGMSQWGAYRWAAWHGWGYQQILAHYYTNITIELPSTGGPLPIGGVTLPWSDYFVTSNRVAIAANASDEASAVNAVGFYAVTDITTLLVTDTVGDDGWSTVWDVTPLSDTTSTDITLSLLVSDGDGHVQSQNEMVRIGLDRQPPTDTTAVISDAYTDTITVTLSSLSATDPNPGSGVQTMAFSNQGWTWEGEDLYREKISGRDSGTEVDDDEALNGRARCGWTGQHVRGAWYGPYTYDLAPGHAYRAYFRLRTGDATTTAEVAMLDVVDNAGERLLGLRRLQGTDFRAADTYQEFGVDFNYTDVGTHGLEFRTAFRATADLCLDRVLVVSYPIRIAPSAQWRLPPGEGPKIITAKFMDGAGNVSADLTRTVTLSDTSPPTGWRDFAPQWWIGGSAPTCTIRVFDEISGLNVESARYHFSRDGGSSWSDWAVAACTGISGTVEMQTITASAVPFRQPRETDNRIEFQIADMKGYTSSMSYTVRSKILYLPLILNEISYNAHWQPEK